MGQQRRWKPLSWGLAMSAPWLLVAGGCATRAAEPHPYVRPPEVWLAQARLRELPDLSVTDAEGLELVAQFTAEEVETGHLENQPSLSAGQSRCLHEALVEELVAWMDERQAAYSVSAKPGWVVVLVQRLPRPGRDLYIRDSAYACDETGTLTSFNYNVTGT